MEDIHIIEQYINGELEGEALNDFKKRLEKDADFAADVKISQQLHQSVNKKNMDFLTALEKVDNEYHTTSEALEVKPKPLPRRRFLRPLLVAASVLLLGIIAWWLIPKPMNAEIAYKNNFCPPETSPEMGNADDPKELLKKAQLKLLYDAYEKMKREEFDAALGDFALLSESPFDSIKGDAMYYKALIHLKKGDLATCKKILNEIIGGDYEKIHRANAEKLLKDVDKIPQ